MFYICSLSSRVMVYKGMLRTLQLMDYFPDLKAPDYVSHLAMVHARFSTNTFPSWDRAHPMRLIAHNGEINTVRGNINWMNARRHSMKSKLFGDDMGKVWPLIAEGQSDSACFDNALELLLVEGAGVPEAELSKYSVHSFRIFVACALLAAGPPGALPLRRAHDGSRGRHPAADAPRRSGLPRDTHRCPRHRSC